MTRNHLSILLGLLLLTGEWAYAQTPAESDSTKKRGGDFVAFPAISYSPETQLTLGVVAFYFKDYSRGEAGTRRSYIRPIAIYTTARQLIFSPKWELFTYKEKYLFSGELDVRKFPFRNYGMTNDAREYVVEYDAESAQLDTLNYLRYTSWLVRFKPVLLRQIRPGLFAGIQYHLNWGFGYDRLSDSVQVVPEHAPTILGVEESGMETRLSGIGLHISWDKRDHAVTAYEGYWVRLNSFHYAQWLGSQHNFHTYELDARFYTRPFKDLPQVLALRARSLLSSGVDDERYPIGGLGEVGGRVHVPGYYRGTFRGRNMITAQLEYRMDIWRAFGATINVSLANTFNNFSDPSFGQFRAAAGFGSRYLLNKKNRTYIRADFAQGFYPHASWKKRQRGIYFSMGENF